MYSPAITRDPIPNIRVIKATKSLYKNEQEYRKLRVCGYGRVSTDSEEQASSIIAQKSYFMDKIYSNAQWDFAGYYEDEGISGKSVAKRLGFQKMIADCKQGKIDLILTKSVSRFSRNILDSITYARALKNLGIEVAFDQDGFSTFDQDAEMRLTIMSIFAQEEIVRQSRSIKFGKDEKIRNGNVSYQYKNWFGYEKGPDNKPVIIPKEASIIEQIFSHYIAGESMENIAKSLNAKEITTRSNAKWSKGGIQRMLIDHKYCGNYLYGKTFKADPLSNSVMKNTGQVAQYLVEKVHDGIITEQTFNLTQSEIKKRNDVKVQVDGAVKLSKYSSKYALTEKLFCMKCKFNVSRKTWQWKSGEKRPVWICSARIGNHANKCESEVIDEYRLHDAIVKALNKHNQDNESIMAMLNMNIAKAITSDKMGINPHTLKNEILMMEKAFSDLISLSIKTRQPELFEEKFKKLSEDIGKKKNQYEQLESKERETGELSEKIKQVQAYMQSAPKEILEYDDTLVRQTIKRIGIIDTNTLKIVFIDDSELIQPMMDRIR